MFGKAGLPASIRHRLCIAYYVYNIHAAISGLVTYSLDRASIWQQMFTNNFTSDTDILRNVTNIMQSLNGLSHTYFAPGLITPHHQRTEP
jgi:hypothetical protein